MNGIVAAPEFRNEDVSIVTNGNERSHPLAMALASAFKDGIQLQSNLPEWILQMEGMSGRRYRCLINQLMATVEDARYLEIGSWAGSTACAAMFGNRAKVTCIDNWSQFDGPKDQFFANTARAQSKAIDFTFIESDFRQVDYSSLGKFNIYLFDGPHSYLDQLEGIAIAQPALDLCYIQIVDDWNWPDVRHGTSAALASWCGAHYEVLYSIEIRTTQNDTHPVLSHQNSDWHNGYFLAVVKRIVHKGAES